MLGVTPEVAATPVKLGEENVEAGELGSSKLEMDDETFSVEIEDETIPLIGLELKDVSCCIELGNELEMLEVGDMIQ